MPRTKLDLPDHFAFSTEIPIRIGDINYGGHLGNDAVLSLIHETRVRFLNHHDFTELDIDGASLIMVDAVLVYTSEAFYGQILVIELAVANLTRIQCDFFYRLTNKKTGAEIARAKTGVAFFNYSTRKPARTPEKFKTLFASHES